MSDRLDNEFERRHKSVQKIIKVIFVLTAIFGAAGFFVPGHFIAKFW